MLLQLQESKSNKQTKTSQPISGPSGNQVVYIMSLYPISFNGTMYFTWDLSHKIEPDVELFLLVFMIFMTQFVSLVKPEMLLFIGYRNAIDKGL